MKTLIELYDERPIENVLASEVFRPERTVFLCPAEVAQDKTLQEKLRRYLTHRGLTGEAVFLESSLYRSDRILRQLRRVVSEYEDCALDITGGTDAALFACGQFCAEADIPVFTYARRNGRFYNIHNAPFADELPCTVSHCVEDCFLMTGGTMRTGRVDNAVLSRYLPQFEPFFRIFLRYRTRWNQIVKYFQLVSQDTLRQPDALSIRAKCKVKTERGGSLSVCPDCLRELEAMGFLRELRIEKDSLSFSFADAQIRTWLRDIGSVLELYVYKLCLDSGLFHDVRTSVVVDWEGGGARNNVTNEIDVMATRGVLPLFLSCKTCEVSTEALNELAVLRDRFGGKGAKAAIVTAKNCGDLARHRASELEIDVIDLNDLKSGRAGAQIAAIMKPEPGRSAGKA